MRFFEFPKSRAFRIYSFCLWTIDFRKFRTQGPVLKGPQPKVVLLRRGWIYLVIAKISLKSPFSWLLADNGSSLGLKRYYSSSRGRGLITPLPSKSWSAAQLLIIRNRNGVMKQLQQRSKKERNKGRKTLYTISSNNAVFEPSKLGCCLNKYF